MDGHGSRKPQAAEKSPVSHDGVCVLDLLIVMETLTRFYCSSLTGPRAIRGSRVGSGSPSPIPRGPAG